MDPRIYYPSARNGQYTPVKPGCGDCAPLNPLPESKEFITHHPAPTPGECSNLLTWHVWLPEVIVGLTEPNEEIAANYVRQSAIRFCKEALVLQRRMEIFFDRDGWAILPEYWSEEQIVKVLNNPKVQSYKISGEASMAAAISHFHFRWHEKRCHTDRWHSHRAEVTFCAAPTELAKAHDAILYERWRETIAEQARIAYVKAFHFKDTDIMRALTPQVARSNWTIAVDRARAEVIPFDNGSNLNHYPLRRAAGL